MEDEPRVVFADVSTGTLVVGYSDGQVSTFLLDDVAAALATIQPIDTDHISRR